MMKSPRSGSRTRLITWAIAAVMAGVTGAMADPNAAQTGPGDTPAAHLHRGNALLEKKEYDKAIAEYTCAIELNPNFAEAYNNRAYASYSKYDGTGDPLADLNRAIELRPEFLHAYNTRGCVYMAGGEPDKAIADFNRAIQLKPDYARAYRNRANAYLRKGHIWLAVADFERAGANPKRVLLYLFVAVLLILGALAAATRRVFLLKCKMNRNWIAEPGASPKGGPPPSVT
jgi:tetratricopeptide (TPR) repeat protein